MFNIANENPTTLYKEVVDYVLENGDRLSPRGKLVAEVRPACIEYLNPLNRITFLATRRINPFFQLAEAVWILSGRSDVEWLTDFNKNMGMFSDDGINFNAPYGERIRRWGDNNAHGIKSDRTLDQLHDVYKRILEDKDTRQAMIAIGNPSFDNYEYLNMNHGKDVACNLYITFKVRNNKLNAVVFNRSNDVHWGVFGANLCQFSTILEVLCSWLRHSGNDDFKDLEVGTYCQITDSLHIYLDSYGAKDSDKVVEYYKEHDYIEPHFQCKNEPRVNTGFDVFQNSLAMFWDDWDKSIISGEMSSSEKNDLIAKFSYMVYEGILDEYLAFSYEAMMAYRFARVGRMSDCLDVLYHMQNCQWKVSMLFFLKAFIKNIEDETVKTHAKELFSDVAAELKVDLIDQSPENLAAFDSYLAF